MSSILIDETPGATSVNETNVIYDFSDMVDDILVCYMIWSSLVYENLVLYVVLSSLIEESLVFYVVFSSLVRETLVFYDAC